MLLIFMLIFELINEERIEITIFVTLLLDIEQSYLTFHHHITYSFCSVRSIFDERGLSNFQLIDFIFSNGD